MEIQLLKLGEEDVLPFKKDMQEAFQKGFEEVYGETEEQILPEADIDSSLEEKGAVAYKAVLGKEMVGGAVIAIEGEGRHAHLFLLYVKHGVQARGVGHAIWKGIEAAHPEVEVWETCTPCFEKRNIYFYVEKCGFQIVERRQDDGPQPEDQHGASADDGGMFIFQKRMRV